MFAEGSLWAAQVAAVSPRGFVLMVGGQAFDVDGRPPVPEGTPLLVRAHVEHGFPVFEVVPTTQPVRTTDAWRLALSHLLRALGPALEPASSNGPALRAGADLGATLSRFVRERLSEPSATLADYLARGVLRLDLPISTPDGADDWHLEVNADASGSSDDSAQATTVALFATLPDTGPVEARLRLEGTSLSVHLVLSSEDACTRVARERDTLQAGLAELGFDRVSVTAAANPARLARDRASDAVPHDTPHSGGLLDVRA